MCLGSSLLLFLKLNKKHHERNISINVGECNKALVIIPKHKNEQKFSPVWSDTSVAGGSDGKMLKHTDKRNYNFTNLEIFAVKKTNIHIIYLISIPSYTRRSQGGSNTQNQNTTTQ